YNAVPENTFPAFVDYRTLDARLSRKFNGIVYRQKSFVLLTRFLANGRRAFVEVLDERGLRSIFSAPVNPDADQLPDLSGYVLPRTTGGASIVEGTRVLENGRWKRFSTRESGVAPITDEGMSDRLYRGNTASFHEVESTEGNDESGDE